MTKVRKFGRREGLNVLATLTLFFALPLEGGAAYQLAQKGSCGGRGMPECDTSTGNLILIVVLMSFLIFGPAMWLIEAYPVFNGRRIPAGRLLPTYLTLCGIILCVGITATRESFPPRLIFGAVVIVLAALETFRLSRPASRHPLPVLLRAATVPASDTQQEHAQPWTGPLSSFEIAHYVAMGVGTVAGLVLAGLL